MNKVTLKVNGQVYEGWKEVEITRSLKNLSGGFSLSITDGWNENGSPWRLRPGDSCELYIGSDLVLTGFLDDTDISLSPDQKSISVSGRDKTADLVDCSADLQKYEFGPNVSTESLAKILCKPFGITVKKEVPAGVHETWKIQPGETVYENLNKIAKKSGVLLMSNPAGELVITRNASKRSGSRLAMGENILSANASFDHKNRFSKYKVQSQPSGSEYAELEDGDTAESLTDVEATATDQNVKRYRPLIIIADSESSEASARVRAKWEASVRAAQATQVKVDVQGWRQADGRLWTVNELVQFKADWLGIDDDLLITGIRFTLSEMGTKTSLELEPAEAYKPEPVGAEKSGIWKELNPENVKRVGGTK